MKMVSVSRPQIFFYFIYLLAEVSEFKTKPGTNLNLAKNRTVPLLLQGYDDTMDNTADGINIFIIIILIFNYMYVQY